MLPSVKSLDFFKKSIVDKRKEDNDEDSDSNDSLTVKRQRTFASEPNQFVVHVFVRLADDEQIQDIFDDFSHISPKVIFEAEPHISLIRGNYAVQYHQIDSLLNQLYSTINSYKQFSLCLSNVQLFCNDEKSRYFIAICEAQNGANENDSKQTVSTTASKTTSAHQDLIKSIHTILKQYRSEINILDDEKIDQFTYHTSVAWFVPEDLEIGKRMCEQVTKHFAKHVILTRISQVCIKIGHRSKIANLL